MLEHLQTVQTQIRRSAVSDQDLHCLLTLQEVKEVKG